MGSWRITDTIMIILMLVTIGVTIYYGSISSHSSDNSNSILRNLSNDTNSAISEIKNFNDNIGTINETLNQINGILNLTNKNIQNLKSDLPKIEMVQSSRQSIESGFQVEADCHKIFNCTNNLLAPINESEKYSLSFLKIKNNGKVANNFQLNIYYGEPRDYYGNVQNEEKDIILVAKDILAEMYGDEYSIKFNPINKIVTINVPKLNSLSQIRIAVFMKERDVQGNLNYFPVQYISDEMSIGNDKIVF